jgi:Flp pilus assembly protein TadB
MSPELLAALLAGASMALFWAPVALGDGSSAGRTVAGGGLAVVPAGSSAAEIGDIGALRRHRFLLALLAAGGGVSFVDGLWGWTVGAGLFAVVWLAADQVEPPGVRRQRKAVRRDLPQVVRLLSIALASGASVPSALDQVSLALPGPGSEALRTSRARLALGVHPELVWAELGSQPELELLGRALARAHSSGVPVADAVRRLGDDLARQRRLEVEDRARAVGIRAALPLGLCLLPAFLTIGIVPVIVAALESLQW